MPISRHSPEEQFAYEYSEQLFVGQIGISILISFTLTSHRPSSHQEVQYFILFSVQIFNTLQALPHSLPIISETFKGFTQISKALLSLSLNFLVVILMQFIYVNTQYIYNADLLSHFVIRFLFTSLNL